MKASPTAPGIVVNGEPRALSAPATLHSLLSELGQADRRGVAAAVNGEVVPRSGWRSRPLADGDSVLLIRATQGG